jgi:hypothetical protein
MTIDLKKQLRALSQVLAGGHCGLSGTTIDALNRAAAHIVKQQGKPDDLTARLRGYARDLEKPGVIKLDDLIATVDEAADRI